MSQVTAGTQADAIHTGRTAKARSLRRRWRERQSNMMATLIIGGICLGLLMIVLAAIALSR